MRATTARSAADAALRLAEHLGDPEGAGREARALLDQYGPALARAALPLLAGKGPTGKIAGEMLAAYMLRRSYRNGQAARRRTLAELAEVAELVEVDIDPAAFGIDEVDDFDQAEPELVHQEAPLVHQERPSVHQERPSVHQAAPRVPGVPYCVDCSAVLPREATACPECGCSTSIEAPRE